MTLHQLLLNIQQGKPVNFASVCKKLPKSHTWQSLFSPEPVGNNKHLVSIIDRAAFALLVQQSKRASTREDAAIHNFASSHDIKCSSAYMLCFPANMPHLRKSHLKQAPRILSAVAVTNDFILPLPFKPAPNAILIENQDCFFEWRRLLEHYEDQIDLSDSDIYFSAGSRILNKSFAGLLKKYSYIDCAFDYDFAGLETAVLLHQRRYAELQFLVPGNLSQMHNLFKFKANSTKDVVNMIRLCEQLDMPELAAIISETRHFMEQEALLTLP